MKEVFNSFKKELFDKALSYSRFRQSCKEYLKKNNKDYDKFTKVDHDSAVGYISETLISNYLKLHYSEIKINKWENNFDIKRIMNIVKFNSDSKNDLDYVVNYFYDKYDLHIKYYENDIYIDVKSALTKKTPSKSWTFLYPVVQAHKKGKSGMILTYCIVNDLKLLSTMKSFVVIGYISQEKVKSCKKYLPGMRTKFKTVNQIENYETSISRDYIPIDDVLKCRN